MPLVEWLTRLGIWAVDAHAATGIPKTWPDHHGAPYSLTEDFATVYRLHPLLQEREAGDPVLRIDRDHELAHERNEDLLPIGRAQDQEKTRG